MKKFFIALFIIILVISPKNTSVHALSQTEYARVLSENTIFYANPDCTIERFVLPYGYFVKILQVGVDSTKVCYMDGKGNLPERVGFIKTIDLHFFDGQVISPYPDLTIAIKADEVLFADTDMQYPKTVLCAGQTATFYGELQINGESFCYVYSNGFIGYVRKSAFASYILPDHPIAIPSKEIDLPTESAQEITSETLQSPTFKIDETLKIVIIIAVLIVCISIVYLIFKPKNTPLKPAPLGDDDDYF